MLNELGNFRDSVFSSVSVVLGFGFVSGFISCLLHKDEQSSMFGMLIIVISTYVL